MAASRDPSPRRRRRPADLHVDGAIQGVGFLALRHLHQLIPAEHPVRMVEKDPQQAVFGTADGRHHAAGRDQVALPGIEHPLAEADLALLLGAQVRRQAAGAAQDDLDACQQFARAERLGQVVVGAHLQSDDAVGLLAARGEHDDRDVGVGAQVAAQREAVVAGQHQVEHHQVECAPVQRLPHGAAIGDRGRAQAVLLEIAAEQGPDLGVVVDDQDVVGSIHGVITARGPAADTPGK